MESTNSISCALACTSTISGPPEPPPASQFKRRWGASRALIQSNSFHAILRPQRDGWGWGGGVKKSRESVEKINLHLRVGRVFFRRKLRALIKRLVGSAALPHRSNCKRPIRSFSRYAPPIDSIRRHESRIRRLLRHPPAVRCSPPSIKRQFDRKKKSRDTSCTYRYGFFDSRPAATLKPSKSPRWDLSAAPAKKIQKFRRRQNRLAAGGSIRNNDSGGRLK